MATDMSQFYQVFFDESAEHPAAMEGLLLDLDVENPDSEQLNAIFRVAHSMNRSLTDTASPPRGGSGAPLTSAESAARAAAIAIASKRLTKGARHGGLCAACSESAIAA